MSRFRDLLFRVMAVLAAPLGVGAGGFIVAIFQNDYDLPYLTPFARSLPDADIFLAAGLATAVVHAWFLLGWIISLDPNRPRRPRLWLVLLGLAPTLLGGGLAWLGAMAVGFRGPAELGGIALAVAVLAAPLALLPDALGSLFSHLLSVVASKAGLHGVAAFALRMRRRFAPDHPGLRRAIGLMDFRAGDTETAFPTLEAEWKAGDRSPEVLNALHQCAHRHGHAEVERLTGLDLLDDQRYARAGLDARKLHRRISELFDDIKDHEQALNHFRQAADLLNPVDLERLGKLMIRCTRWTDLETVLLELEAQEVPPRTRLEALCHVSMSCLSPANLAIAKYFADYLHRQKRASEESEVIERVLEVEPTDPTSRRRIIAIYRQTLLTDRLIKHLQYLADQQSADADLLVELAELLISAGELERADAIAVRGSDTTPGDYRFQFIRATCALKAERYDDARSHVEKARELCPEGSDPKAEEMIRSLRKRVLQGAAKAEMHDLEAFCTEHPDNVTKRLELVTMLLRARRTERAATHLDQLLDRKPDSRPTVIEFLDRLIEDENPPFILVSYLHNLAVAAGMCDRAFALNQRMADLSMEKQATLEEGAARILSANPTYIPALVQLAGIRREQKKWTESGDLYRQALKAGWHPATIAEQGEAFEGLVGSGDLTYGRQVGTRLMDAEPFNVRWLGLMAQLHIRNDRLDEGLQYLARARELEPGNANINRLFEETRRRQREGRMLALRELLDKTPDDGDALEELGDLLSVFDRHEEALRTLQKASQHADNDDKRRLRLTKLAWVMHKRRMYDTALETLREVPLSLLEDKTALNERKRLFYEIAEDVERQNRIGESLELFKQVFKVDAGFRHVMEKMERLGR